MDKERTMPMIISKDNFIDKKELSGFVTAYEKYVGEGVEVIVYHYDKGVSFTMRLPKGSKGIDLSWIAKGSLLMFTNQRILNTGDTIILTPTDGYITLEALEETVLYSITTASGSYESNEESYRFMNETMDLLQEKDQYTKEHCINVMKLSKKMIPYLNLTEEEAYHLMRAAKYHDIGKIKIADGVLNKPAGLSDEEYDIMKNHVESCKTYLASYYGQDVVEIILQHHERLDGSGYPKGLKGDEISKLGKVLAILDTYDAMTTERVYKKAKSKEEALEELEALAGIHYDSDLVALLKKILKDK